MRKKNMAQNQAKRKANRKERRRKARTRREGFQKAAKKLGLQGEFERSLSGQEAKLAAQGKVSSTLWNNQVKLQGSYDLLEEQFFVFGRTVFPKVNEALLMAGSEDLITEEYITNVFREWSEFKKRPDFRKYFAAWLLGKAMSSLPPPPEPKVEEKDDASEDTPEGAIEFGGDYAEGQGSDLGDEAVAEEQPEGDESSPEASLSEVQDVDEASPSEGEEGTTLP
jgi:hypothetical protein